VAALRFFFVKTLKRHQFRDFLPYPQDRRRLPTVLSREEVSRLINAAGNLFRRTLLMTLYGTGMRRAELAHLKGQRHRWPTDAETMFVHQRNRLNRTARSDTENPDIFMVRASESVAGYRHHKQ
jgi:integrase